MGLERTISMVTGKGLVSHNSRKFHAKNTDPERSCWNVEYCNESIRTVYHELFDDALARYNAKQTRMDRRIDDYYEKIRSGRQEKTFHEIIVQIGDKDNMGAKTENGRLAAKVLDEYMRDFQRRNPVLRVFSAYLHMDEATPHLHIDFIPYTTGSKRGLDTRVSLKQAMAVLGFKGGTRSETELNQWISAEKDQLAAIMQKHGIEWEKKGTHEKHLSVLDFEKKERAKEVAELEEKVSTLTQEKEYYAELKETLREQLCDIDVEVRTAQKQRIIAETEASTAEKKAEEAQKKLSVMTANIKQVEQYVAEYARPPDNWLPEPATLETAKSYRKRVIPMMEKLVRSIRSIYVKYLELKRRVGSLTKRNEDLEERVNCLNDILERSQSENIVLRGKAADLDRVRAVIGVPTVEQAIEEAKRIERCFTQQRIIRRKHDRDSR